MDNQETLTKLKERLNALKLEEKEIIQKLEALENKDNEQKVTPWEVIGKNNIDYMRLVKEFGTKIIDPGVYERIERLSGLPLHCWLRRGLFFSHRGMEELLNDYEKGRPFFLYTGRGPSSPNMHLGHLVPFMFTKYLQDAFQVPVVIQMADDEKFFFKDGLSLEDIKEYGRENIKDIIACGFDPSKTFIFYNSEFLGGSSLYEVVCRIQKKFTGHQNYKIYGLDLDRNLGQIGWPSKQAAPAFSRSFPHIFGLNNDKVRCLVPYAIDQDPYFRMARDFAGKKDRIKFLKPSSIMSKFLPSLMGAGSKMSSTKSNSNSTTSPSLFLNLNKKKLTKTINKYAFSGGGGDGTLEDHIKYGGDLDHDVAYQYLLYWMDDDKELKEIAHKFAKGEMMCGEIKKRMIDTVWGVIERHQIVRAQITDEIVESFMTPKKLDLSRKVRREYVRDLNKELPYSKMGANFDLKFGARRPVVVEDDVLDLQYQKKQLDEKKEGPEDLNEDLDQLLPSIF